MISVIVAIFNPIWIQLKATLLSIVQQERIITEIIIADDGSNEDYSTLISSFFEECNYYNYKILRSKENKGTCFNVYNAIMHCKYDYVKCISPGDCLFHPYTLQEWLNYMIEHNSDVSFSKAVYYDKSTHKQIKICGNPKYKSIYRKYPINKMIEYLLIPDAALGAALLVRKTIALKYLKKIVGHVTYCEDYYLKLYVFDNGKLLFFDKNTLWYEYGEGVSTSEKWRQRVKVDKVECAKVLYKMSGSDIRWKKIWEYQIRTGNLPRWRFFMFPRLIKYLFIKKDFDNVIGDNEFMYLHKLFED
ncbi:Glycosyltransferase, GT2 family [Ruminococcaceae bacterium FB2012]|nr:Glycosyltransferase, GT2 family [Ruminococcaceae bacterium FB2012]